MNTFIIWVRLVSTRRVGATSGQLNLGSAIIKVESPQADALASLSIFIYI